MGDTTSKDLPTVDFERLRCSECRKYLSVPPIYIYTDSTGKEQNVCGRCELPPRITVTRNTPFESLAKFAKFPCSAAKNCKEILTWDGVTEHETTCQSKAVRCTKSSDNFLVTGVPDHFKESHRSNFFEKKLTITLTDNSHLVFSDTYLLVYPNISCFVTVHTDSGIDVSVKSLLPVNELLVYSVFFSSEHNTVSFKNNDINKSNSFDIKSILKTLETNVYKFEMEIVAGDQIPQKEPNDNKHFFNFNFFNFERSKTTEASIIVTCINGHSFIRYLRDIYYKKDLADSCPYCNPEKRISKV